ncbi:MAG: hypothetical protein KDD51_11610 [Bdellovibrionales bacterium]|nr:hypothetical protein [Bdellovibrionales bacterium]
MKNAGLLLSLFGCLLGVSSALAALDRQALPALDTPKELRKSIEEADRAAAEERARRAAFAGLVVNFTIARARQRLDVRIERETDAKKKAALEGVRDQVAKGVAALGGFESFLAVDSYVHSGFAATMAEGEGKTQLQLIVGSNFLFQYANDPEYYDANVLGTFAIIGRYNQIKKLPLSEQVHAVFEFQSKFYELTYDKTGPQMSRVERIRKAVNAGPASKEFAALVARESMGRVALDEILAHEAIREKIAKLEAGEFSGSIVLLAKDREKPIAAAIERFRAILKKVEEGEAPEKVVGSLFSEMAILMTHANQTEQTLEMIHGRSQQLGDGDGFGAEDTAALKSMFEQIDEIDKLLLNESFSKIYQSQLFGGEVSEKGEPCVDEFRQWLKDQAPGN